MKDPYLNVKLENANKEHLKISMAKINNDTHYLVSKYGSLKHADERLLQLEYFLNFKTWK